MAAELSHLITLYEQHRLTQAAEQLRVLKTGLEAQALIPPRLAAGSQQHPQGEERTAIISPCPVLTVPEHRRSLRIDEYGVLRIREERLSTKLPHELDALGLPRRFRTALVQAGCSKVADVQFFIEQGVLQRVRHIGPVGAQQITEQLRRWTATQPHQESTAPQPPQ